MKTLLLLSVSWLSISGLVAQSDSHKTQANTGTDGLAIRGYDPVAYFTTQKAIEGKKELSLQSAGITYYFSTPENRELFKTSPSRYEPQYGGWCAFAMGSTGEKVDVDPATFKVLNGRLYLFYNRFFNNTLKSWNKDESNLRKKADANWTKLLETKTQTR